MTATVDNAVQELAERGLVIGDQRPTTTSLGLVPHHFAGTGEVQAEFPLGGKAEIDAAAKAARVGLGAWQALAPDERGRLLMALADSIGARAQELAHLETLECGRPISETINDSYLVAMWTRYYAGWTDKIEGRVVPLNTGSPGLDYVVEEPYGVIGAITPFNIPMSSLGMKAMPAIAAGNAVVVKPSDKTPFTAVRIAELALEVGIPAGVFNVVPGGIEAGDAMVRHPGIDKVSFTGGPEAARHVIRASADTLKPIHLELGGKSANIIFPDADLDAATPLSLVLGSVALAGQGCILPTRLFVHTDVYDEVQSRLLAMIGGFPLGDPLDPATMVGPVISAESAERIIAVIEGAKSDGAGTLLTGGERAGGDLAGGYFIQPTLFGDVDHTSSLAQKEIFGPVLSIIRFSSEDEVLAMANGTEYGLFSYLWTQDVSRVHRFARDLEAGSVCVNGMAVPPSAPFGGTKQSGFGREGGEWGLREFLRPKNVYIGY